VETASIEGDTFANKCNIDIILLRVALVVYSDASRLSGSTFADSMKEVGLEYSEPRAAAIQNAYLASVSTLALSLVEICKFVPLARA